MQVKVQGILNAKAYIEREHGADSLARVLSRVSPAVRERVETGIALEWHDVAELVEFVETADKVLYGGGGTLAEEVGAEGARQNTRGFVKRAVFWLANPEFILRRVGGLWSRFNDQGEMELLLLAPGHVAMEVRGHDVRSFTFCSILTGWAREIARAIGFEHPKARHVECKALGHDRCVWEVIFDKPEDEPPKGRGK